MNSADDDPHTLLTEAGQWTEPWGGSDHGRRCDKCSGSGRTRHECWSCLLTTPRRSCPVCGGQARWDAACPVCRGTGEIDGRRRHGVSVFPTLEGLYHYMLANEADIERCVVLELEAELADDVDFDADEGALLVIPTAISSCSTVDQSVYDRVRRSSPRTVP
jgi:hypothetical protein